MCVFRSIILQKSTLGDNALCWAPLTILEPLTALTTNSVSVRANGNANFQV